MTTHTRTKGFTMVELIMVIVIIGILAALVIVTFTGIQDKARKNRAAYEVRAMGRLMRSIEVAGNYETLHDVTGSYFSSYNCYNIGNIQHLPKTHPCWVAYNNLLDKLEAGSSNSMSAYRNGDPWGAPYILDENEGEPKIGEGCERKDTLKSAGPDGIYDNGADDISWRMERYKPTIDCADPSLY